MNEYERGRIASRMNAELDNNPNPEGTLAYIQWAWGFRDEQKRRKGLRSAKSNPICREREGT